MYALWNNNVLSGREWVLIDHRKKTKKPNVYYHKKKIIAGFPLHFCKSELCKITYCSSGQPAGQWYKRPTGSRRSRDTSGRSRAPSRATTRTSKIRTHNVNNNPTGSGDEHESGLTFPLSMHRSSVCITSELQHPHKHNTVNTQPMLLRGGNNVYWSLPNLSITSATNWLAACACSLGGPCRKREEHRGGRSTLGTEQGRREHRSQSVFVY